jgi:6,7-dimethyl-8-ribityllumazine synthase
MLEVVAAEVFQGLADPLLEEQVAVAMVEEAAQVLQQEQSTPEAVAVAMVRPALAVPLVARV